jgi:hypothetical protein
LSCSFLLDAIMKRSDNNMFNAIFLSIVMDFAIFWNLECT